MKLNYVMVLVSDMERSTAFFRDVLELPLRFASPGWTEFDTGGTTLALHPAKSPPTDRPDPAGAAHIGIEVADLDGFHTRMVERGVTCTQAPAELYGSRVATYAGPDGFLFSAGEPRGQ